MARKRQEPGKKPRAGSPLGGGSLGERLLRGQCGRGPRLVIAREDTRIPRNCANRANRGTESQLQLAADASNGEARATHLPVLHSSIGMRWPAPRQRLVGDSRLLQWRFLLKSHSTRPGIIEEMRHSPVSEAGQSRTVKILIVVAYAAIGFIGGAVVGLIAIPLLGSLVLSVDYQIPHWNGQAVGEIVGLLIGIWIGIRRYVINVQPKGNSDEIATPPESQKS